MPDFLNAACAKRSVQLPLGHGHVSLPSSHLIASLPSLNCGASLRTRKMLHWSLAEVPSVATMRISAPIRLGRRDDRRHVADIADVLLAGQHRVDDDGALQADLELDVRALRQVLLLELLAAHDDAGPRLGVVGLIADDELDRLARFAELDGCVRHRHHQGRHARAEHIPIRLLNFDIPSSLDRDRPVAPG